MQTIFPRLVGEIAKRGIKKTVMAKYLGISERSLYSKLSGETSFKWNEVQDISNQFFPDMDIGSLFETVEKKEVG